MSRCPFIVEYRNTRLLSFEESFTDKEPFVGGMRCGRSCDNGTRQFSSSVVPGTGKSPEMARRSHQNVLAEMLEKVLAYNISQIIRVRKKLSETEQMERAAA
jgi:hypothetical protein